MFVTSGYWIPKYSLHEVNYIEKHVHFFTEVSPSCSYLKNLKPFGAYVRCLFPVFFWNNQEMGNCIRCSSAALPVSHSEVYSSRFESNPMNTLCTKEAGLWQLWQRMRDHWDHDTSASQVSKIAMQDLPCHGQIIDIMPSQFHVFRFFKYILWFFMMGVMQSHCFSLFEMHSLGNILHSPHGDFKLHAMSLRKRRSVDLQVSGTKNDWHVFPAGYF
jgi:hypothetical protein